jgi:hypothetical protein
MVWIPAYSQKAELEQRILPGELSTLSARNSYTSDVITEVRQYIQILESNRHPKYLC